jgi:hypothetical protein
MNNTVKKFNINFSFITLAIILATIFFMVSLGSFKYYQSEIKILFIPKNEKIAAQTPYIMENLVRFPGMLSFYEKTLRENSDIADQFAGKSKDERKKMWNEMLDIQKDDGSSIISFKITSRDKNESQLLAKKTVQTFFSTASFYYDIKTDIDLRIVDETVTKTILKNWAWLLVGSIIFGLALSFVLNSLLEKVLNLHKFKPWPVIKKEFFISEKPVKSETISEMPATQKNWQKTSGAPANLPVGEPLMEEEIFEEPEITSNYEENIYSEPSEEEMKKKLNQLLRGEL